MWDKIANWPFLQEPAYRWFIFVGVLLLIFACWHCLIGYMKKSGT